MLRQLNTADSARLRAFWAGALRSSPENFLLTKAELLETSESSFRAGIENGVYLGAFDSDGALVGVAIARRGRVERLKHTADIGPVYVQETSQGHGLGRALMEAVCERLQADGLLQAELAVDAENHRANALYRSLGFVEFGLRPRSVLIEQVARNDLMMMITFDGMSLETR